MALTPSKKSPRSAPDGGRLQRTMRLATSCRRPSVESSFLIQSAVIVPSTMWGILQKQLGHRTVVTPSVSIHGLDAHATIALP